MSTKSDKDCSVEGRIRSVYDRWFLSEPALHAVLCSCDVRPDFSMSCSIRSGEGRIDYQPEIMDEMDLPTIEMLMRSEVIRIMLKHPYTRRPENCSNEILTIASNCVLTDNYDFSAINLDTVTQHGLDGGQYYEWYAHRLNDQNQGNADNSSDDNSHRQTPDNSNSDNSHDQSDSSNSKSSQSELWHEDEMQVVNINRIIQNVRQWGSLPGSLVEEIIASTQARIDYRKVMSGFRSSVMSSRRNLTRMRPNRRTDFENMGSIYRFSTSLLVAVDVSGSIMDDDISRFYSVINRFFRYGIEQVDTVQFDVAMGEIVPLKKAVTKVTVHGRGGTSFQMLFDYVSQHPQYDGLVILTDGYAQRPEVGNWGPTKVLWVCNTESEYEAHHEWMEKIGRCCVIK